jgi:NADPH2:quinone reductase
VKAVVYSTSGSSSVLSLVEREPAEPGSGQMRVRVAVSGVNPTDDWKARAGGTRRGDFADTGRRPTSDRWARCGAL